MNKLYILIILLLMTSASAFACDICGCSHSNFQIGLLPNFNKGFVGIRYSYTRFDSQMQHEEEGYSKDTYQTVELWGGYQIKKWQLMAFVPYIISEKENDEGVKHTQNIGDAMVLVNYRLFSQKALSKNEKTTKMHEVYLGGGVKLPTGGVDVNMLDEDFNIGDFNSQAGTGSVDFLFNVTHNWLWNNSGIVTNFAYRINTTNSQEYHFGNRVYGNTSYFYTIAKAKVKWKPNAGFQFQSNAVNTFQNEEVMHSNGYNLNVTAGLNILFSKIGFNAMAFVPMMQNNFDGQTEMKIRALIGMTYSF